MKEIRYETPIVEISKTCAEMPSIFLAGPTVRGHQLHFQPSWRFEACELLKKNGFNGAVIIPEFEDVSKADKGNEDWIVPWEDEGLTNARVILCWVPRTKELIGLNTNFEAGYWFAEDFSKVIYGRPDGSYRNKYLDIMYQRVMEKKLRLYHDVLNIDSTYRIYQELETCCAQAAYLANRFWRHN